MRYLSGDGNILVLIGSTLALPLQRRGAWPVVLSKSVIVYTAALIHSPGFYLTSTQQQPWMQNWAMWQMIVVPALVVGWLWREARARSGCGGVDDGPRGL